MPIKGFGPKSDPPKRVRRRPGDEGSQPLDRAHRIREMRRLGERIGGLTPRDRTPPPPPDPEGDPPPPDPEGDPPPPPPDKPPEKIHPWDRPIGRKKGGDE